MISFPSKVRLGWARVITHLMIVAIAVTLGGAKLSAQSNVPSTQDMDERIAERMASRMIPGVAVGVVQAGELVHVSTYGLANVEAGAAVSDSSVFEIGSISKQFLSVVLLQMIDESKLELDHSIARYLPTLPSEWRGATIRQLLTHTSGIPDYEAIQTYEAYRLRFVPEDIIRVAHSIPVDFAPGSGWNYSNTGYFLLSLLAERVDQRPLAEIFEVRLFGPLGMAQTRMTNPETVVRHRASGYWTDRTGAHLRNRDATQPSSTLGAGGLMSSIRDLARWDAALRDGRLLPSALQEEMWTAHVLPDGEDTGYGFGWEVGEYRGMPAVSHTGMVAGFVAGYTRLPQADMSIIVLANRFLGGPNTLRDIVADTFVPAVEGDVR